MPDDVYTHGHHESVLRSHLTRNVENSAAYLLPHLRSGLDLLDVGCGPATITADLAGRVAPGHVVGVDRSLEVLAEARSTLYERGVAVELVAHDVYGLAELARTFDVVHAHQVLQHLSDPVAALRQMWAVTRPGGLLAVRDADYDAFRWYPEEPALDRWLELYRAVARHNGAEPDAGRRLAGWVTEAGFTVESFTVGTWCWSTPSTVTWWADLWADRLTESDLARHAVECGLAEPSELAELADGWRRWASRPGAVFWLPNGEVLARA